MGAWPPDIPSRASILELKGLLKDRLEMPSVGALFISSNSGTPLLETDKLDEHDLQRDEDGFVLIYTYA